MKTPTLEFFLPILGDDAYLAGKGPWGAGHTWPWTGNAMPGMLGREVDLNEFNYANILSQIQNIWGSTAVTGFRHCTLQWVKFKTGSTATPTKGLLAYYASKADYDAYIVTPDANAGGFGVAGVIIATQGKGDYGLIAVEGAVQGVFVTPLTEAGAAFGEAVYASATKFDTLADATAIIDGNLPTFLGYSLEATLTADAANWVYFKAPIRNI